jgi:site-specific recombinase XerD
MSIFLLLTHNCTPLQFGEDRVLKITFMNNQPAPQFLVFAKRKNSQAIESHLYLKISFAKETHEKSLGIKCLYSDWDHEHIRITSDPVSSAKLSQAVELVKQKLMGAYYLLKQEDACFSLQELLDVFSGNRKPGAMSFCQTFRDIIIKMERHKGVEGSSATNIQKHNRALDHFQSFCKLYYKVADLSFQKITRNTIDDFVDYLKAAGGCSQNTAMKYVQIIKKIYRYGMDQGWVKVNAFANFKFRMKVVDRDYLTEKELDTIRKKEITSVRLSQVRDVFVFSCFTGLAYIDVKNLKRQNIIESKAGYWIKNRRTKTGVEASIPLLPPAKDILDTYSPEWPSLEKDESLLKIVSNQKMNAYLKEIADICGINKIITFHLARHTFATTVTLNNDIPLETVSKMLGHSRISMTQHYSKVVDLKIERDTLKLYEKFKKYKG